MLLLRMQKSASTNMKDSRSSTYDVGINKASWAATARALACAVIVALLKAMDLAFLMHRLSASRRSLLSAKLLIDLISRACWSHAVDWKATLNG